jgi:uncharacterized protein (DUF2267 family)
MEEVRRILLNGGQTLEVSMKPEFLDRVSLYFQLGSTKDVTDEHVRLYVFDIFKNAIDKAENEGRYIDNS